MNKVPILFQDMSLHSDYCFLEFGKDDDELKKIAEEFGLQLPSKDLVIFKGKYAFVNEENKNGCTLPKDEVEKALKTLRGKAIDKDHLRKSTIGYWLDSTLKDNTIYSYGAFWKSNFPEDYEEIKKRTSEGKLKISFEAWGDREGDLGSYNLKNIEFAGGALLFDTKPAFDNAEVMEFAKVLSDEEKANINFGIHAKELEEARLDFNYDMNNIAKVIYEHECSTCKAKGWQDVLSIDFENSKIKHKCIGCGEITESDLTPSAVIKKKGKKPKKETAPCLSNEQQQMTELTQKQEKGGNTEVDELLKKYNKANVDELIAHLEKEIASLTTAKDDLTKSLEESQKLVETVKAEAKVATDELSKRIEAEKAAIIKSRKDELGEFAKDMKDEEILDDVKFELAKLKKENSELKAAKVAEPKSVEKAGLEAGTKDPVFEKQTRISEIAFKNESEE